MLGVLQIQGNIFICLGWLVFRPLRRGEGKVLSNCRQVIPRNHSCVVDGSSLLMIQLCLEMLCYSNMHTYVPTDYC